jgi:hypothetical protein
MKRVASLAPGQLKEALDDPSDDGALVAFAGALLTCLL